MATELGTPAYRLFDTRVVRTRRLSPTFVRVTLGGPSLALFAPWGLDQRVKLILPRAFEDQGADVAWHGPLAGDVDGLTVTEWRAALTSMPAGERHPARTYTPRAVRPLDGEVDIDFFVHEPAGPASAWAASARPGDRLLISGPDVRADDRRHGIQWRPEGVPTTVLLLGDETAVPALAGIAASLDPDTRGTLAVEAADPGSCPPIGSAPSAVEVRYLPRGDAAPGAVLAAEIARWARSDAPRALAAGIGFAAWIAAESTALPRLRSAVAAAGIPRERVHSQGYWTAGARRDSVRVG